MRNRWMQWAVDLVKWSADTVKSASYVLMVFHDYMLVLMAVF